MSLQKKIRTSLFLQITTVFVVTLVFLGLSIIGIQRLLVLNYLRAQALDQHTIVGRSISENLKSKLKAAETLAASLANIYLVLPKDTEIFRKVIPSIIDYSSAKSFIAGGGVWPEPGKFIEGVERRSFFWGRNQEDVLEYYDDYNTPEGSGYHHEEWYVPARYLKDDQCYWSKSYVDPYSYQPMVTCTIAIRDKGEFVGVSTIDLKLEGLSDILSQSMKPIGGYAFAIDRNNKFLAFPDESKIQRGDGGSTEVEKREYIDTQAMVSRMPHFAELAARMDTAMANLPSLPLSQTDTQMPLDILAKSLDEASYQINETEALRIAHFLIEQNAGNIDNQINIEQILIDQDVVLNEPAYASIFFLPKTDWKLVLITPTRQVLGTANEIAQRVAFISLAVIVFIMLGFFAFLQRLLMVAGK